MLNQENWNAPILSNLKIWHPCGKYPQNWPRGLDFYKGTDTDKKWTLNKERGFFLGLWSKSFQSQLLPDESRKLVSVEKNFIDWIYNQLIVFFCRAEHMKNRDKVEPYPWKKFFATDGKYDSARTQDEISCRNDRRQGKKILNCNMRSIFTQFYTTLADICRRYQKASNKRGSLVPENCETCWEVKDIFLFIINVHMMFSNLNPLPVETMRNNLQKA
jgi:hypothetical protein